MAIALLPVWCGAAEPIGVVTIADGDAVVFRKAQKFEVKVGSKLWAQDILQTNLKTRLVRAELSKGGIFDLGPGTSGIVHPGMGSSSGKNPSFYLLKGWLKVSAAPRQVNAGAAVIAERFELTEVSGSAVVAAQTDSFQIFAESGALSVWDRKQGKSAVATTLAAGALYAQAPGDKAAISARVPGSFTQGVPKGLRESLPPQLDKFKSGTGPTEKSLGDLTYADALPWLSTEPALRKLLVTLWSDPLPDDLHQGLESHIAAHPEWRATLFPEKVSAQESAR
jgi:hypothetical protein